MNIYVKNLPHPEKDHDNFFAKVMRPDLGIVTLADGMGEKGTTRAADASRAACEQIGNGLSNLIEKIRDKQDLSVEERKKEIRRDLVDLIVEVNNETLTGRKKKGDTTLQAGVIDLENKIIQVENVGDSSIFLVYTDGTFDYLTPKPRDDIQPRSKPDKWLGMYPHLGDDLENSNVKKDLNYYRVKFQNQVEIYTRTNELNGIAEESEVVIPKQLARIVFATDGVTNTLKHDELEAVIAGAPVDENYDLYLLTQLAVAARYPYRKVMDRLYEGKVEKILQDIILEKGEKERDLIKIITDAGINPGRLTSPNMLKEVIIEIADTETGKEVRRYLGEKLSHLDDTMIVSVNVLDNTGDSVYCLTEGEHVPNELEGMMRYGPYTKPLSTHTELLPTIPVKEVIEVSPANVLQIYGEGPIITGVDSDPLAEEGLDPFLDEPTDPSLDVTLMDVDPQETLDVGDAQIPESGTPYVGQKLEGETDDVDSFKQWFDEYEQTKANLAKALGTIAEQTERLTKLESIIASEQEERATLSVDLEELKKLNREYEDNLGRTTAELDGAKVALQARYEELQETIGYLQTRTEELEAIKSTLQTRDSELNETRDALEEKVSELTRVGQEITIADEEITKIRAELTTAYEELRKSNETIENLQTECEQLGTSLEESGTQYETTLEELTSQHDAEIAGIRQEHDTIIERFNVKIEEYERTIEEYRATTKEYEATIVGLRESNETITTRVSELESLYSEASRKQSEAVARIEELLKGSDTYKDYISPEEYGKALADKDAEHATALEAITSKHTTALEAKEKEVEARYTGYLSNEDHLRIVREAEEAIETRYAGQQEELERLRRLDELKDTRVSELELELRELTENYQERLGDIEQLDSQITELTRSREENSEIIGSLRSELEEKADELAQISESYSTTSTELAELKTQYAERSTALDEANVKIRQYEKELEELESLREKITTYQGIEERLEHAKAAKTAVDGMLESAQRLAEERLEYSRGLEAQLEEVRTEKTETERLLEEAIEKVADYKELEKRLTEAEGAVQDYEARITELKGSYEATIKDLQTRITAVEQERDDKVSRGVYEADIIAARKEAEAAGRLAVQTEADERYEGYVAPDLVVRREEQAKELGAITGRNEIRAVFRDYVEPDLAKRREEIAKEDGETAGRIDGLREGEEERRAIEAENRRLTKLLDEKVTELAVDMKTVESIRESLYNMQIRINNHTSDIFGATQTYYSRSEIKDNPKNTKSNANIVDEESRVNEKEIGVTYKKSEYHPERGTTHIFNVRGNLYRKHEKGKKQGQAKGDAKSIDMDCYVREVHDEATGQTRYEIDTQMLEISAKAKHDILYSMARILNISYNDADSKYARKEKVKSAKRLTALSSTEMKQAEHPDGTATVIQGEMYHTKESRFNKGKPTGHASDITIMYQPVTK